MSVTRRLSVAFRLWLWYVSYICDAYICDTSTMSVTFRL